MDADRNLGNLDDLCASVRPFYGSDIRSFFSHFIIVPASLRTESFCVSLIRFNIAQLLTPDRCSQQTELGPDHSSSTQSLRYLHSSRPYL